MPARAPSRCPCGVVTPAGSLCPCRARRRQTNKAAADARRPTAARRGYGPKWQAARKDFLHAHPRCERCGKPATVVHHREPHRLGQARTEAERKAALHRFWSRRNWMPVCRPCHDGPIQAAERRQDGQAGFRLSKAVLDAAARDARAEYPREACGLVVGETYRPCANVAADPLNDFEIPAEAFLQAEMTGSLRAVVHSHPDGPSAPSDADREAQRATALPWIIIPLTADRVLAPVVFGDSEQDQ